MSWLVEHADCLPALARTPDACVDALVTDPPAGIGFMGKTWDKPSSYGFSGKRIGGPPGVNLARNPTCQVCGGRKRAGPATRGCSCDVPDWNETALRLRDRAAFVSFLSAVMREARRVMKPGAHGLVWALPRTSHWTATALEDAGLEVRDHVAHLFGTGFPKSLDLGEGRGTALKPASEHWILVRKPVDGTTTSTVERWGTGGLEIDACRLGGDRWPANVVLSHDEECGATCEPTCAVRLLDEQAGERVTAGRRAGEFGRTAASGIYRPETPHDQPEIPPSRGGASRFFYVAKPSPAERDLGLEAFPVRTPAELTGSKEGQARLASPRTGAGRSSGRRNFHPTVKSIALMRWLCRLVTPPGGVVLDPFCGSGSTGCAAVLEGLHFAGIEQDPEFVQIARARISAAAALPSPSSPSTSL